MSKYSKIRIQSNSRRYCRDLLVSPHRYCRNFRELTQMHVDDGRMEPFASDALSNSTKGILALKLPGDKMSGGLVQDQNAKKPGKTSKVPPEHLYEVLKDLPIFDENFKALKPKEKVWRKACLGLNDAISVKYLLLILSQDRHKIRTRLLNYKKGLITPKDDNGNHPVQAELVTPTETLKALQLLKSDVTRKPMFRGIGVSPFYVLYWFPDQRHLWQDYAHYFSGGVVICKLDGIVGKAHISNIPTELLSFYALFTRCGKDSIPFMQFVAEEKNDDLLEFCIGEFLREKVPAPTSILMEISMLETITILFNEYDINEYTSRCMCALTRTGNAFPRTIIKIDTFLVMNYLKDQFDQQYPLKNISDFLVNTFLFFSTLNDFEVFDESAQKLFLLLINEYLDPPTMTARQYFVAAGDEHPIPLLFQSFNRNVVSASSKANFAELMLSHDFSQNKSYLHFTQLRKTTEKRLKLITDHKGHRINPYYSQQGVEKLIQILSLFPFWTNLPQVEINGPHEYHLARELFCEQQLNFVPRTDDGSWMKLSPEEFLKEHSISLLNSFSNSRQVILAGSRKGSQKKLSAIDKNRYHHHLNFFENWMNKGTKKVLEKEQALLDEDENDTEKGIAESNDCLQEINGSDLKSSSPKSCSKDVSNISNISMDHSYSRLSKTLSNPNLSASNRSIENLKHSTPQKKIKPKRQAKYFGPCPSLNVHYNMPKKKNKFKDVLIKNGNNFHIARRGRNSKFLYKLANTCLLDVIVEMFAHAIRNFNDFYIECQKVMSNNGSDLLKMIFSHATKGNLIDYYEERYQFLLRYGTLDRDVLYLKETMSTLLEKAMGIAHSVIEVHTCSQCLDKINGGATYPYLDLLITDDPKLDQINVQKCIMEKIVDLGAKSNTFCDSCTSVNNKKFTIGPHLAIIPTENSVTYEIEKIQDCIVFSKHNIYFLAGVVGFSNPVINSSETRFVCYIRSMHGNWQVRDGSEEKITKMPKHTRKKIALIVYIRNQC